MQPSNDADTTPAASTGPGAACHRLLACVSSCSPVLAGLCGSPRSYRAGLVSRSECGHCVAIGAVLALAVQACATLSCCHYLKHGEAVENLAWMIRALSEELAARVLTWTSFPSTTKIVPRIVDDAPCARSCMPKVVRRPGHMLQRLSALAGGQSRASHGVEATRSSNAGRMPFAFMTQTFWRLCSSSTGL